MMEKFNQYLLETLQSDVPYYDDIIKHLHKYKGKQVRSKLSLLCAGLGGEINERSYRSAMIVEMLHTASLLHDDIVDNSKERRSAPSINNIWGERVALYSGDIISLKALQLSLNSEDYEVFKVYVKALGKIIEGELLQLKKTAKLDTDESTYLKIIESKTAAFFYAACKTGAMSTFQDTEKIESLGLLGQYIGIAFQIKDDIFSYGTDDVGKPIDNDFQEKKVTLPLIYTYSKLKGRKRRKVRRIFRKRKVKQEGIDFITQEVLANGGLDYANQKMQEYGEKAFTILERFSESKEKTELQEVLRYATERSF